jgi:hypothetical protein
MAELQADPGLRIGVNEVDDAPPRRLVPVVIDAGAAERNAGVAVMSVISVNNSPAPPMARAP